MSYSVTRIDEMISGDYEFIKFIVSHIEGLEWKDNIYGNEIIYLIRDTHIETHYLRSRGFRTETYPFLLTRAIDGINETDPWKIDVFFCEPGGWNWSYKDHLNSEDIYRKADDAREAALLYVKSLTINVNTSQLNNELHILISECKTRLELFNKTNPGTKIYNRFISYIEDAEALIPNGDTKERLSMCATLHKIMSYYDD